MRGAERTFPRAERKFARGGARLHLLWVSATSFAPMAAVAARAAPRRLRDPGRVSSLLGDPREPTPRQASDLVLVVLMRFGLAGVFSLEAGLMAPQGR